MLVIALIVAAKAIGNAIRSYAWVVTIRWRKPKQSTTTKKSFPTDHVITMSLILFVGFVVMLHKY